MGRWRGVLRGSVTLGLAVVVALSTAACGQPPASEGEEPAAETPRTPDGTPDLSGIWINMGGGGGPAVAGEGGPIDEQGNVTVLFRGRPCAPGQSDCAPGVNFERDSGIRQRMHANKPWYRPEHWERVQYLDVNGNSEDPEFKCYVDGVPRMGPPSKILQTPTEVVFLYQGHNTFRVIPVDGRPHDEIRALDQTLKGDSVGTWDGDTLVIDTVGFSADSWLGWPGYFHSNNMHVVETVRREGNTLTWQATVTDPEVLIRPWEMDPIARVLNPDPMAVLQEDLPCEERDLEHMMTRERG